MAKSKGSLIPMRGSVEDWGPGKHQRNLEAKEHYARKMQEQVSQGPPDFGTLLSLGLEPTERGAKKRTQTRRESASRRSKKSAKKRR